MNSMVGRSGSLIQLPKRTEVSSLVINLFNKLLLAVNLTLSRSKFELDFWLVSYALPRFV